MRRCLSVIAVMFGVFITMGSARAQPTASGGTAVIAISADPGHLNPAITTSGATHAASELLYNGLLARDERGEPVGDLAESWTVEQGGALYRFHLRDGITWHDGVRVTAGDVKFAFEAVLLKYHARTKASMNEALAGIETPDERTVVFRFHRPYAPLLLQLDATEAPIVARHVYENGDPQTNPANVKPVGTGPFKFVSYVKGAEIRLARNPSYFRKGLPHLDGVVMRVIPDASTRLAALENGELDFLWEVPGPALARITEDARFKTAQTAYHPGGSNCIMTIGFNLDRALVSDVRVRRAIAHALDRQTFLQQILFGEGRVADAPISSGIPWAHAHAVGLPKFDRARAGQLLEAAGWKRQGDGVRVARGVAGVPEGRPLAIDFVHFPAFAKYGELLRQQLAAVGVDVTLRPLEPAVFAPTVFKDRNFDLNIISYCNGPDPEIGVRRMYASAQIGPVPFTNAAAYRNAKVDALFDQAARTVEQERRATLYRQIQEMVVDDLPYLWIVETLTTRVWPVRCGGFRPWTGLFAETAFCKR